MLLLPLLLLLRHPLPSSAVDLAKGTEELVKSGLDGGGGHINAIGYNPLDNYIYGISGSKEESAPRLVRIDSAGRTKIIGTVPAQTAGANKFWFTGDIDQDGYLWASGDGKMWIKTDLKPGSSTYGQVLDQGTSDGVNKYRANNWVYVPGQEGKLYSVLQGLAGQGSMLAYFDTSSKKLTTVKEFGKLVGNDQWGALYVGHDGTIYGSENDSGEIWKFKPDGSTPTKFTSGPTSKQNDGARCANAPDVA
ncbi:hypothetical protein NLG97_g8810 [Lecanicillium saksenae]|uniref:Uncharacterized protein n=1 Tax=Lecanicillium saksenae TaxID=468837 RepID=A0ACC1QLQ3_9HYPO|nr:hypothetical protein NLG97_g8810 [Lecanicillium saksenae]